jgi:signal transduction histidine kinase
MSDSISLSTMHDGKSALSSLDLPLGTVANLAHELRTPVQVLLGYIDMLRDGDCQHCSNEHPTHLDRMSANIHDLALTIDNLMHFVSSEIDCRTIIDENVSTKSLIDEIMPVLEAVNQNRIALTLDFASAPDSFGIPRRLLKTILLNMAVNGIKFTEVGSVILALRGLYDESVVCAIEVEVSDTGLGLSLEDFNRAKKPFVQLSETSRRRFRGLGLGLAVVQRSVDALGGKMELRSRIGQGANFLITIPVRPPTRRVPSLSASDVSCVTAILK